jgi:hypothetical protein
MVKLDLICSSSDVGDAASRLLLRALRRGGFARPLQNAYPSFTAIPFLGENLSALLDEVRVTQPEDTMAAAELTTTQETEQERIERWRAGELERAGYEASAAALLATRADVDLHYATDLLRNGCAPELALQILL